MSIVLRKLCRESRRDVTLFLSSFLDEKSSDENGGIRRRVNTSSSASFQEERHVKIEKGMLVQFFGFEIWANPFLREGGGVGAGWVRGGCRKLALFFEVT